MRKNPINAEAPTTAAAHWAHVEWNSPRPTTLANVCSHLPGQWASLPQCRAPDRRPSMPNGVSQWGSIKLSRWHTSTLGAEESGWGGGQMAVCILGRWDSYTGNGPNSSCQLQVEKTGEKGRGGRGKIRKRINRHTPLWKRHWSRSVTSDSDHVDCSPPGSSSHGIFQARILEWVAISFSRRSSWPRGGTQVFCIVGRHFTVWATRKSTHYYTYIRVHTILYIYTHTSIYICVHTILYIYTH